MGSVIIEKKFIQIFCASFIAFLVFSGIACKQKSSKKPDNSNPPAASPNPQATGQIGGTNSNVPLEQQAPAIRLATKSNGETVTVDNIDLNALGGVPVEVAGISPNSILVGILDAPAEVLLSGSGNQYKLSGKLPFGVTSAMNVVLLARDKEKCKASDCGVVPDGSGRFPQGQVTPNSNSDVQGQFLLQVKSSAVPQNPSGLSGGANTDGVFKRIFNDPIGLIKDGASKVFQTVKGLFGF